MDTRTSLTQERWKRIEEIFLEVVAAPLDQQDVLLGRRCDGDDELRRHVQRMIDCHDDSGDDFLESPSTSPLDPDLQTRRLIGQRIGAFRLIEPIASGGMGTVWLAERDGELQQRVALKLLNWGLVSVERRRLFEKERQALAQLEHPYITRLIDGGATEDGLPYLVMEYVEGMPLDRYCDAHRLTIRQRLELFRKVCEAVNFSHQNLIVHRDLKPSNILVSEQSGQPKLLDFGVSKLLDDASTTAQAEATITVVRAFTPRYASPEQVRGGAITTAADVYSLGVLLYELLTGARPYAIDGSSEYERAQQICEVEPELPSRVVTNPATRTTVLSLDEAGRLRSDSPEGLRRRLRGDLDTIVLKAMQKEPGRRYASAEQLSEDIGRYLSGLPVRARKDTISYRLSKFVLRNRAVVVATTVVLFTLLSATVGIVLQWQSARRDRDSARRAQQMAETITTVFQNTLFAINPERRGGNASLYMLLPDAVRQAESELQHEPLALARVRYAVGSTYASLRASEQAETHLRRALRVFRTELGSDNPETAGCLDDLGWLRLQIGEPDGIALLREAIAIRVKLYGADQRIVADAKCRLAYGLAMSSDLGPLVEAEALLDEAERVYRRRFEGSHPSLAFVAFVRGWMDEQRGALGRAVSFYREARDEYNDSESRFDPGFVMTLERFASVMEERGNYAAARRHRIELMGLAHTLYGEVLAHKADWSAARVEHLDGNPRLALGRYVQSLRNLCLAWYRNMPAAAQPLAELGNKLDQQSHMEINRAEEVGFLCGQAIDALGNIVDYEPELRTAWLIDLAAAMYELGARNTSIVLSQQALRTLGESGDPRQRATVHMLLLLARYDGGDARGAERESQAAVAGEGWSDVVLSEDSYWHLALVLQEFACERGADRAVAAAEAFEQLPGRKRRGPRAESSLGL